MIIDGVDPRDIEWEVDQPVYRVYFWDQPPAPPGVRQEQVMWHCEEYRLQGAIDVREVTDWAEATARAEQHYVLYVEHRDSDDDLGLLRLTGTDPTATDETLDLSLQS